MGWVGGDRMGVNLYVCMHWGGGIVTAISGFAGAGAGAGTRVWMGRVRTIALLKQAEGVKYMHFKERSASLWLDENCQCSLARTTAS